MMEPHIPSIQRCKCGSNICNTKGDIKNVVPALLVFYVYLQLGNQRNKVPFKPMIILKWNVLYSLISRSLEMANDVIVLVVKPAPKPILAGFVVVKVLGKSVPTVIV